MRECLRQQYWGVYGPRESEVQSVVRASRGSAAPGSQSVVVPWCGMGNAWLHAGWQGHKIPGCSSPRKNRRRKARWSWRAPPHTRPSCASRCGLTRRKAQVSSSLGVISPTMSTTEVEFSAARGRAVSAQAYTEAARCAAFAAASGLDAKRAALIFYRISPQRKKCQVIAELVSLSHGKAYDMFLSSCSKAFSTIDSERNDVAHWQVRFTLTPAGSAVDSLSLFHPNSSKTVTLATMNEFSKKALFWGALMRSFAQYLSGEKVTPAERATWQEIFGQTATYPPDPNHPLA